MTLKIVDAMCLPVADANNIHPLYIPGEDVKICAEFREAFPGLNGSKIDVASIDNADDAREAIRKFMN